MNKWSLPTCPAFYPTRQHVMRSNETHVKLTRMMSPMKVDE